jgi:hypothetical protein
MLRQGHAVEVQHLKLSRDIREVPVKAVNPDGTPPHKVSGLSRYTMLPPLRYMI